MPNAWASCGKGTIGRRTPHPLEGDFERAGAVRRSIRESPFQQNAAVEACIRLALVDFP